MSKCVGCGAPATVFLSDTGATISRGRCQLCYEESVRKGGRSEACKRKRPSTFPFGSIYNDWDDHDIKDDDFDDDAWDQYVNEMD